MNITKHFVPTNPRPPTHNIKVVGLLPFDANEEDTLNISMPFPKWNELSWPQKWILRKGGKLDLPKPIQGVKSLKDTSINELLIIPKIKPNNPEYTLDFSKYRTCLGFKKKTKNCLLPETINMDGDFAELCGFIIAEGGTSCKRDGRDNLFQLTFNKKETEYIEYAAKNLEKYFNINPTIRNNSHQNSTNVYVSCEGLSRWYIENFRQVENKKPAQTKIPNFVYQWDNEMICRFIIGWYKGDGSHSNYRKIQRIITVSKKSAQGLQYLGLMIGCFISLTTCLAKNSTSITHKGSKAMVQDQYTCILNGETLYKLGILQDAPKVKNGKWYQDDVNFYLPITSINPI
jgi:hypothetical protein